MRRSASRHSRHVSAHLPELIDAHVDGSGLFVRLAAYVVELHGRVGVVGRGHAVDHVA